jgi:hypothetical protein
VGLKLNGTYQLLIYADVNLFRDNMKTVKKTEKLIDASKEAGIDVNAEKTSICCFLVTRMQGKIMTYRQLTDPLKMWWHSSNICYSFIY